MAINNGLNWWYESAGQINAVRDRSILKAERTASFGQNKGRVPRERKINVREIAEGRGKNCSFCLKVGSCFTGNGVPNPFLFQLRPASVITIENGITELLHKVR